MNVEFLCARESARLLRRDPKKYYTLISALYLGSLINFKTARLIRTGYLFVRHMDDVLDGDSRLDGHAPDYVDSIKHQIESCSFTSSPKIVDLAEYFLRELEGRARQGDNPRQDLLDTIDAIVFDYQRARDRRVLSLSELETYYRDAFFPPVNLLLVGLGSRLRARDVPELSYGQGRVYSVRDLETDWERGVINIPMEVLDQSHLSPVSQVESIKGSHVVRSWFSHELSRSKEELLRLRQELKEASEIIPYMLCNGVLKAIDRIQKQRQFV